MRTAIGEFVAMQDSVLNEALKRLAAEASTRKRFKSATPSHWGSLGAGPVILTSGGERSAKALIFAHSVMSPQY